MRIIGGVDRGRRIEAPPGRVTRPITDRAKESVFNMLASMGLPAGCRVIDLYAGSGSFGLEALSRGADHVTFVERDRVALATLRANIAQLDYADRCDVKAADVGSVLPLARPAEIAFCDPPYPDDPWNDLLSKLAVRTIVVHADHPVALTDRWLELKRRKYGRSHILIAERPVDS